MAIQMEKIYVLVLFFFHLTPYSKHNFGWSKHLSESHETTEEAEDTGKYLFDLREGKWYSTQKSNKRNYKDRWYIWVFQY